jgi:hypothetical protein
MTDANYASACGAYCGDCRFLGDSCGGCGYVQGRPIWATQTTSGICPVHDCCRNKRGLEHCGLCRKLPCKGFLDLRDPNMSEKQFCKSLDERQTSLKRRAEVGTQQWLMEATPYQPVYAPDSGNLPHNGVLEVANREKGGAKAREEECPEAC